ncbi:MAG: hypothetical protein KDK39_10780 [Leptospiraceae bacterium]|nr:hypothetical protein [Leptospiraceae bacterium]
MLLGACAGGMGADNFVFPFRSDANSVDLSGQWIWTPVACLPGETLCNQELQAFQQQHKGATLLLPDNLHRYAPWFIGQSSVRREFSLPQALEGDQNLRILIGGVGSLDSVWINGVEVGSSGYDASTTAESEFLSAWSKVRFYSVHRSILRKINEIEIRFTAIDVKAGVHRGPVLIGTEKELQLQHWLYVLFFESIFQAETILAFFIFFFFVSNFLSKPVEPGFGYMGAAFAAYAVHSLYFISLPIGLDYLLFLKVQWVARILSQQWIILSMLCLIQICSPWLKKTVHGLAAILILVVFTPREFTLYLQFAAWTQAFFQLEILIFLALIPILYRRQAEPIMMRKVLFMNFIINIAYSADLLLRLNLLNTPWLYHYMALFNMLQFLGMHSHKLYAYQAEARIIKHQLLHDRLRFSMELHDVLGAHLSEIIVHSHTGDSRTDGQKAALQLAMIQQLAGRSLRFVRDLASFLKWEDQNAQPLARYIQAHLERLRNTGRYAINYQLDEFDEPLSFANLQLQRVYSEWMANVLRHSRPGQVRVRLRVTRQTITLWITDDGAGFSWRGQAEGSGLAHIADRMKSLHGRARSLRTATGGCFYCRVPLASAPSRSRASFKPGTGGLAGNSPIS